jgi:hypothetical protein
MMKIGQKSAESVHFFQWFVDMSTKNVTSLTKHVQTASLGDGKRPEYLIKLTICLIKTTMGSYEI